MKEKHTDYDAIAQTYDQRYRVNSLEGIANALGALARTATSRRILEVGCGTGRWIIGLNAEERWLFGIDPYREMLYQARKKEKRLSLICGRDSPLAFKDNSIDMVFCVNAIHHFDHPGTFIAEAGRVLKPGGSLAIVGIEPHDGKDNMYVYTYFSNTYETDIKRFPTWKTVAERMKETGFVKLALYDVDRDRKTFRGREVLSDPFLQKQSCSQLAQLTDEEYAAGMQHIEATLTRAEIEDRPIEFRTDLTFSMLSGLKS